MTVIDPYFDGSMAHRSLDEASMEKKSEVDDRRGRRRVGGRVPLGRAPRRAGVDAPPAGAGGAAGGGRRAGAAASDSESLPKTDPGPNRPQEPDLPGIARHWNSAGADQPVFPTTPPPLVPRARLLWPSIVNVTDASA